MNDLEEEETLLIYTAQGSPFRRKKLSVINGSPEQQRTKRMNYALFQPLSLSLGLAQTLTLTLCKNNALNHALDT